MQVQGKECANDSGANANASVSAEQEIEKILFLSLVFYTRIELLSHVYILYRSFKSEPNSDQHLFPLYSNTAELFSMMIRIA